MTPQTAFVYIPDQPGWSSPRAHLAQDVLKKIAGLPLLKRSILNGVRAGIKKVFVVSFTHQEILKEFIARHAWPVTVELVGFAPDETEQQKWQKISALAHEPVLLITADRVYSANYARQVQNLADDVFKTGDIITWGHAGTDPTQNGFFVLKTPSCFEFLFGKLKSPEKILVRPLGDEFFCSLSGPDSVAAAEDRLLEACRKPSDGPISRVVNRRISLFISKRMMHLPFSANQITVVTALIGIFSGIFAAQPSYFMYALGGLFFNLASILDGVDGELSKLKLTESKLGQWLDTASDNASLISFVLGTLWHVFHRPEMFAYKSLGVVAIVGLLTLLFVMFSMLIVSGASGSLIAIQNDFLKNDGGKPSFLKKIFQKVYIVIKRDFFATLFMFIAFFDGPHVILFCLALATHVAWMVLVLNKLKRAPLPEVEP